MSFILTLAALILTNLSWLGKKLVPTDQDLYSHAHSPSAPLAKQTQQQQQQLLILSFSLHLLSQVQSGQVPLRRRRLLLPLRLSSPASSTCTSGTLTPRRRGCAEPPTSSSGARQSPCPSPASSPRPPTASTVPHRAATSLTSSTNSIRH